MYRSIYFNITTVEFTCDVHRVVLHKAACYKPSQNKCNPCLLIRVYKKPFVRKFIKQHEPQDGRYLNQERFASEYFVNRSSCKMWDQSEFDREARANANKEWSWDLRSCRQLRCNGCLDESDVVEYKTQLMKLQLSITASCPWTSSNLN